MRLCLVTDRRRLGTALHASAREWPDLLLIQVKAAAVGGVDLIQVREPDLEAGELAALIRRLLAGVRNSPVRVVVNDRLDVALAVGAHGVHLREGSFGPAAAHRVAADFSCGCSVHDEAGVQRRPDSSYFIAGTVLPTISKAPGRYLGWQGLSAVVKAAAGTPVLGIGGLGLAEVPKLLEAGASGLAAIGAFIPSGSDDLADFVQKRAENLRLAFDSGRAVT